MINVMPNRSSILTKLLIVGALAYGYTNRNEIRQGLSGFLERNQMFQEAKSSLKWLYDEVRPMTEAEKAQHNAYVKEQRRRREYYRSMGIKTQIEYASPQDGEKWKQAVKEHQELMKHFSR